MNEMTLKGEENSNDESSKLNHSFSLTDGRDINSIQMSTKVIVKPRQATFLDQPRTHTLKLKTQEELLADQNQPIS